MFSFLRSDVQRACVRLPSSEREGSESEERRGTSAHTLHGQDWRNSEPLQRRHHCLPMWVILSSGPVFQKSVVICCLRKSVLFSACACMSVMPLKACCIYISCNLFDCVVSDRSTTKHHPISQRPPALRAGIADSGGDRLLWAGRPDRQREHSRKHHHCKSLLLELA